LFGEKIIGLVEEHFPLSKAKQLLLFRMTNQIIFAFKRSLLLFISLKHLYSYFS